MAHAGFWAFGAVAAGLIVTGFWLNSAGAPPAAAVPTDAPDIAPAPVPPDPAAPEPAAEAAPPMPAEAADMPADPEPDLAPEPQAERPPPAGFISRVDGPGGIMWRHDGLRLFPPEAAQATPSAAADAAPVAELPDSDGQTPDGPAVHRDDLVFYSEPPEWVLLANAGVTDSFHSVLRGAFDDTQSLHYFGAVAVGSTEGQVYLAQGYSSVRAAERAAMDICARKATECRLVAHLKPGDFDGRQGDMLTRAQGLRWQAFHDLPLNDQGPDPLFRAIALSEDGSVGTSDHSSQKHARQEALDQCREDQAQNRAEAGAQLPCQVVAERGPAPVTLEPAAIGVDSRN